MTEAWELHTITKTYEFKSHCTLAQNAEDGLHGLNLSSKQHNCFGDGGEPEISMSCKEREKLLSHRIFYKNGRGSKEQLKNAVCRHTTKRNRVRYETLL